MSEMLSNEKIANCLERVADDHSGDFTDEDAEIVEAAINALRRASPVGISLADEQIEAVAEAVKKSVMTNWGRTRQRTADDAADAAAAALRQAQGDVIHEKP